MNAESICLDRRKPAPPTVNYLIHFSTKWQYLYVETPKVACSAIKKSLQTLELDGDSSKVANNVHDRSQSPLHSPNKDPEGFKAALNNPEYKRFAFVRNPFTRILSCYLDKFVINEWERNWRLPKLGFERDARISFLDFLNVIRNQSYDEMDIHWMPQSYILSRSYIDYAFIGRLESFDHDFAKVFSVIKDEPERHPDKYAPHATGAGEKLKQYLGEQEKQLVLELYERDFVEFVYPVSLAYV